MTGGDEETSSNAPSIQEWPSIPKKSYKIADILKDTNRRSINPGNSETIRGHSERHLDGTVPTISSYQPFGFFNAAAHFPVTTSEDRGRNMSSPTYSDHFPKDLSPLARSNSPPRTMGGSMDVDVIPALTSGHSTSSHPSLLSFLPSDALHPPPPATFFQSPGYISLLLANHFAQPYLHHHQRIPDFNAYTGRPLIMGSKRKGGQVRFAAAQTARLEKEFLDHKYLHANDRKRLAQALKLTDRQVKTWFQNRRAKWRKVGVHKGHRSESHVSASYGQLPDKDGGYSPDQGRSVSVVSSILSDDSS